MAAKDERVRDFLATRRAKVTPEMVGLPPGTRARRVPGLRREEVAMLADVSVDYYTRIEKGDLTGVSDEILEAISRSLRLTEDERVYLYDLARTARRPSRVPRQPRRITGVPAQVQLLLDSMAGVPVLAHNGALDVLASNSLGRALFDIVYSSPTRATASTHPNLAAFVFLDPAAREFYTDFEDAAMMCVRTLRSQAGATPHDSRVIGLVGELSTRSDDFSIRWASHDVGSHRTGTKKLHHRDVGELSLGFEQITLTSAPSITLSTYIAEPGSATAERLQLLSSWTSTLIPTK
jgi:transcriptional regulator with XRE-family HTH domain